METRSGFDPSNKVIFKIPFFEIKRLGGGWVANVLDKKKGKGLLYRIFLRGQR